MFDESKNSMFEEGLKHSRPPATWPEGLKAMWFDAKGNWEQAHQIAQDLDTLEGSRIHAYLHRKEGDGFNAGYWYQRANRPFPSHDLESERQEIINSYFSK